MMSANPDAKGSRPINEAYKDRFCAILDLEKLSKNDMIRMVRERSHFENEDIISRMIEAWEKINNDSQMFGEIKSIDADKKVFGRYFIATGTRGLKYGVEA